MVLSAHDGWGFGDPPATPIDRSLIDDKRAFKAYSPLVTSTPTVRRSAIPNIARNQDRSHSAIEAIPPIILSRTTPLMSAFVGATDLNLTSGSPTRGVTTLMGGLYYFDCVHIGANCTVSIAGGVTIFTTCFNLDAGATITGVGAGFLPGKGPDPGVVKGVSRIVVGGGGHGGAGGTECGDDGECAGGGAANDDPVHPSLMGSGGVETQRGNCVAGGGLLKVVVIAPVSNRLVPATINGTIDMSGSRPCPLTDAGGGAGGTILIETSELQGTGILRADGGNGSYGSGGGGGIISLIENRSTFGGTLSVIGGNSGNPGIVTFSPAPVSGY